jgi:hypothetical protein
MIVDHLLPFLSLPFLPQEAPSVSFTQNGGIERRLPSHASRIPALISQLPRERVRFYFQTRFDSQIFKGRGGFFSAESLRESQIPLREFLRASGAGFVA